MIPSRLRLGLVLHGDRMTVATLRGGRLDTFTIEAEQPAAALRAEFESRRLRPRTVAIGLPRAVTTVKPIELPEIGDLGDMVRFELDRHLPFPAEDAPFDFLPLPADRTAAPVTSRRVVVAAADRRVVDGAVRIAQEAGLRPTSVTVAVHDLLALVRPARGRRVAWVHGSGADADLLFLVGPRFALSRHVPAGDEETVAAEIRRSLPVLRWREVDEVWVSGETTAPATPTTSPLATLGAPIVAPPWSPAARRLLATIEGEQRGARELAAAVALGPRARPLDLIPSGLRPRRLTRPQLLTLGAAAVALVLLVGAIVVPGIRHRQQLVALDTAITRLAPEMRSVEQLQRELDRKRAVLATIDTAQANAIKALPAMRELTELLPNDAWLTLMSLDGKGVELTGQAAAASALIPLLENSPRFERVEFASPVTRGRDREQFRIVARWEGGLPGVVPASASGPPGVGAPPAAKPVPPSTTTRPGAPDVQRTPRVAPPAPRLEPDVSQHGYRSEDLKRR